MRRARQLFTRLIEMVQIQVAVAAGPDEIAHIQIALLRDHVREQRIRSDVERHAQEDVGAALIHLARQPAVGDVELEERMAGRQCHLRQIGDVPGRHDQPARIRVAAQTLDDVADLVDVAAVGGRP